MSDYTDYENNLVFAPTSADDLNEQKRQSDVLIAALEKCEKLEKDLRTVVKILKRECPDYQDWLEVNYREYMEK